MKQSPQFEIQTELLPAHELTDAEWLELERLLKSLDSEEALQLPVLEGYIAGVLCCPVKLKPSDWFPLIWGDEHAYDQLSDDAIGRILDLVLQHYNFVKSCLEYPENYYLPAFVLDTDDTPLWEFWAEGFDLAMMVGERGWTKLSKKFPRTGAAADVVVTLMSILDLGMGGDLVPEENKIELRRTAPDAIPILTKAIYELNTRGKISLPEELFDDVANTVPKVGRNDPCPCGSGKKYKKCHGA